MGDYLLPGFFECKMGRACVRATCKLGQSAANPDGSMGIDSESDVSANLQIGPTSLGMVRIYVEGDGFEAPLDFDPEEAEEIAEEIRAAAGRARAMAKGRKQK